MGLSKIMKLKTILLYFNYAEDLFLQVFTFIAQIYKGHQGSIASRGRSGGRYFKIPSQDIL